MTIYIVWKDNPPLYAALMHMYDVRATSIAAKNFSPISKMLHLSTTLEEEINNR